MSARRMSAEANGRGSLDNSFKKAITPDRAQSLFALEPPPSSKSSSSRTGLPSITESKAPRTDSASGLGGKDTFASLDLAAGAGGVGIFDPLGLLGGGPSSPARTASGPAAGSQSTSGLPNVFGSPGKHQRRATASGVTGMGAALPFTAPGFAPWDEQFRGQLSPKTLNSLSNAFATKVKNPDNPLSPGFKKRELFPAGQFSAATSLVPEPSKAPSFNDDFLAQFDFSGTPATGANSTPVKPTLKPLTAPSSSVKHGEASPSGKSSKKGSKKSAPATPSSTNIKPATPSHKSGAPPTPSSKVAKATTPSNKRKDGEGSDSESEDSSEASDTEEGQAKPKKPSKKTSKNEEGKVMTAEEAREARARSREETLIRRKKEQQAAQIEEMKADMARKNAPTAAAAAAASIGGTVNPLIAAAHPITLQVQDDGPKRRPTGTEMKIEALAVMKKGTPFLKYGKQGFPHFRLFLLSDNQEYIAWFSKGKKMRDTIVKLSEVDQLRIGQTTPTFARHPAPELAASSLSLIYKDGIRTLDLIAKDPNEFSIWTQGLRQLIIKAKVGQHTKDYLKSIIVDVDVQHNKTSTHDLVDAVTGETAVQKDEKMGIVRTKKSTNTGDKRLYKDVAKQFNDLKKRAQSVKDRLNGNKYYTSSQFSTMNTIAKKLDDYVLRISLLFTDGEYEECDDEIWRASVELEGLQNLMKSAST